MIQFTHQEFKNENPAFQEKFRQAMKEGIFYLGIPEELKENLPFAVQYAENLPNNTELKTLTDETTTYEKAGFESFSAMEQSWKHIFPTEIQKIAYAMNAIAIDVLKTALQQLSIPEEQWDMVTCMKDTYCFTINSYHPAPEKTSLSPHKDKGWITVLFMNKAGLERYNQEHVWEEVLPKEGYFVINFGYAFEVLAHPKLNACIHRVRNVIEERISIVVHQHHDKNKDIYCLSNSGDLFRGGSYKDYHRALISDFKTLQFDTR